MKTLLHHLEEKIKSWEDARRYCQQALLKSKKIVFTNGCFDLLHAGHVQVLAEAASLGDVLVVGLNTDASVRRLKGEKRPLQDERSRALVMAAQAVVDVVVLFDEDTPLELIKYLEPHTLVKGGDYAIDQIVGSAEVLERGGSVITVPLLEGYSTSNIVSKM